MIGVSRKVADSLESSTAAFLRLLEGFHRSLSPATLSLALLPSPQWRGGKEGEFLDGGASAKEVMHALSASVNEQKHLFLETAREQAASALLQCRLLSARRERESGMGPLRRLQKDLTGRAVAALQGTAAGRAFEELKSRLSQSARRAASESALWKSLKNSSLAEWLGRRRPVDVSIHYLSPTAFGLAPSP